ncbi:unnamed protein product, partial [Ectocarpus sp. 12 AP-2014]
HPPSLSHPRDTLWVFARASTPPYPSFITPQTHPVRVRTCYQHPVVHHTPLRAQASCTLSPGLSKIPHPTRSHSANPVWTLQANGPCADAVTPSQGNRSPEGPRTGT